MGHHGSKKSLDASLAERLSPKVALIGVGEANRYGHPSQNTLDFLEKTGCATYCSDAVSYTHLDVYKRQASTSTWLSSRPWRKPPWPPTR